MNTATMSFLPCSFRMRCFNFSIEFVNRSILCGKMAGCSYIEIELTL